MAWERHSNNTPPSPRLYFWKISYRTKHGIEHMVSTFLVEATSDRKAAHRAVIKQIWALEDGMWPARNSIRCPGTMAILHASKPKSKFIFMERFVLCRTLMDFKLSLIVIVAIINNLLMMLMMVTPCYTLISLERLACWWVYMSLISSYRDPHKFLPKLYHSLGGCCINLIRDACLHHSESDMRRRFRVLLINWAVAIQYKVGCSCKITLRGNLR